MDNPISGNFQDPAPTQDSPPDQSVNQEKFIAENPQYNPNNPNVPLANVNESDTSQPQNVHGTSEGAPPDSQEDGYVSGATVKGTEVTLYVLIPRTGHRLAVKFNGEVDNG